MYLKHIVVVVFNPDLPETLQGQHTADAHLMENLLHYIWKGTGSQPSLSVHRHTQQAGDVQVVLMDHIRQGFQHTLLGQLKAGMCQDCSNWLIQKLPAGGPAEFYDRFTFTSNDWKNRWEGKCWLDVKLTWV